MQSGKYPLPVLLLMNAKPKIYKAQSEKKGNQII
jgi:hypothetical protein